MPYLRVTPVAVAENAGFAEVIVTLDQAASSEVRVTYDTLDGNALQGGSLPDYQRATGTLVFAPGETSKTVRVTLTDDVSGERPEAFWFSLSNAVNATVQQRQTAVTVYDNDITGGTLRVQMDSQLIVDERDGQARLVVWLDRPATQAVPLLLVTDPLANAGDDLGTGIFPLTLQPGQVVQTFTVPLRNDTLAEGAELFGTGLFNGTGGSLSIIDSIGRLVIAANDAAPVGTPYIRALPAAGDEAQPLAGFTVLLSAPSSQEVRVTFDTLGGSASLSPLDSDFQRHSGVLVFAPGETSKFVPVMLTPDGVNEADEVFWLELSSPVNGIVEQARTPGLLVDNDGGGGTPSIVAISDAVIDEAEGLALFYIQLDRPITTDSVGFFSFSTVDVTASAGSDYHPQSGQLIVVPAGETLVTVAVQLIDDGLAESDERFELRIEDAFGLTLLDHGATAIIGRNDTATASGNPVASVQPIVVSESDAVARFTITLDRPSSREVRLSYDLDDITATARGGLPDFQRHSGTLIFAPGDTVKTVTVALLDDSTPESSETFRLSLSSPVNTSFAQSSVTATIFDNDGGAGSGTLWSLGQGNDRYTLTSSNDRIAESLGGGIDTVRSEFSWVLPDQVENLVLMGPAGNGTGNALANVFRGHAGANRFDGLGGVDTVVFGSTRAAATVTGTTASRTVSSSVDGSDTLLNIERLQFSDVLLAYDTSAGGRTHAVLAIWQAAFNRAPDKAELSRWTATLDAFDGNTRDLAQALINAYAPGVTNDILVTYLWSTLFGGTVPADVLASFTGLLANGTFSQASLVEAAALQEVNLAEIAALVGQPAELDASFFPIPS